MQCNLELFNRIPILLYQYVLSLNISGIVPRCPDHCAPPWDALTTKSKPCVGDCWPLGLENDTPTQTDPLIIPTFVIGTTPHCTATEEHLQYVYCFTMTRSFSFWIRYTVSLINVLSTANSTNISENLLCLL